MALFSSKKPVYDRAKLLDAAEKARAKGKTKKAISEYRKVLAVEPADAHVNQRVAPLLFKAGDRAGAQKAFETAAESFADKGFADKALAVYVQAAGLFPLNEKLWSRAADMSSDRGRRADSVKYLLQGAEHLGKSKAHRASAIPLIERALAIDPAHVDGTILLARTLAKLGRKKDGLQRLDALAGGVTGPALKRIRKAQFGISPSPATFFRWLFGATSRPPARKLKG